MFGCISDKNGSERSETRISERNKRQYEYKQGNSAVVVATDSKKKVISQSGGQM
jgi:hypothetical protein